MNEEPITPNPINPVPVPDAAPNPTPAPVPPAAPVPTVPEQPQVIPPQWGGTAASSGDFAVADAPMPKPKSKKVLLLVSAIVIVLLAGSAVAYVLTNKSKSPTTAVTPAAAAPNNAAGAAQVAWMKEYANTWKTDPAKAQANLDLASLKADPTCNNSCSDEDVISSMKFVFSSSGSIIDSYESSGTNTVKVHAHLNGAAPSAMNGGYEFTLKADGSTWKIIKVKSFQS